MRIVTTEIDGKGTCPECSTAGAVAYKAIAMPLGLALCAFWIGGAVWDHFHGSDWQMLGWFLASPVIWLPWFGRCGACGSKLRRSVLGKWV
jgi:hypothetical protein